jgi:hypothetical protein
MNFVITRKSRKKLKAHDCSNLYQKKGHIKKKLHPSLAELSHAKKWNIIRVDELHESRTKKITTETSKLYRAILSSAAPEMPPLHNPSTHRLRTADRHANIQLSSGEKVRGFLIWGPTWLCMELNRIYKSPWISHIPQKHGTILITATSREKETQLQYRNWTHNGQPTKGKIKIQ